MSVVIAAIAVFPVLTVLLIGLSKAENVLSGPAAPGLSGSTPADLSPVPLPVQDPTVS